MNCPLFFQMFHSKTIPCCIHFLFFLTVKQKASCVCVVPVLAGVQIALSESEDVQLPGSHRGQQRTSQACLPMAVSTPCLSVSEC